MHEQTLAVKTQETLALIKDLPLLTDFYLAGGTGLALQLGHRRSIDLDFFTPNFPHHQALLKVLKSFTPEVTQVNPGTLDVIINQTKVSFLEYDYPMVADLAIYRNLKLAKVRDIATMKLSAITSRGSRKDFIDLYFILEKYSLAQVLTDFTQKFAGVDYSQNLLLRSLVYFVEADSEPSPEMLINTSWEEIKKGLTAQVTAYLHERLD
jgi:hypothetical protein